MHYEDGGHAFPRKGSDSNEPEQASWQSGMTLRDYFAAAALTGMVSNLNSYEEGHGGVTDTYSGLAYKYADSMLAARDK